MIRSHRPRAFRRGTMCLALLAMQGVAAAALAQTSRRPTERADQRPQFDLRIERAEISFSELRRLIPALDAVSLPPDVRVERLEATGALTQLRIEFRIVSADSDIAGDVTANVTGAPRTVHGTVELERANLARLLDNDALPTRLTATVDIDLRIDTSGPLRLSGPVDLTNASVTVAGYAVRDLYARVRFDGTRVRLEQASARAYGGDVTAAGTVGLPFGGASATYDLSGRVSSLDVQRLPEQVPVPRVAGSLNFDYALTDSGDGLTGRLRLGRSSLAGAVIRAGTMARMDLSGEQLRYSASGAVRRLDPRPLARAYELVDLAERLDGNLNLEFTVQGRGATVAPLELHLTDSALFGGTIPMLDATVRITDEAVTFEADGRFADINPGVAAGVPRVDGALTGSARVSGRLPRGTSNWQRLELGGRVQLEGERLQGVPLTHVEVRGRLADLVLRLQQFEATGRDLEARASGVLSFDPAVASDFDYYFDTPRLDSWGAVVEMPMHGDVKVEGTVTGHAPLQVDGSIAGTLVGYGDVRMNTLDGRYRLAVPRERLADASANITLNATRLSVAGRTLDRVTLEADYASRVAGFAVRMQEGEQGGERTLTSSGRAEWRPERQAVTLDSFAFETADLSWRMPGDRPVRVTWDGDGITVDYFRLQNADRAVLVADGVLGGPPAAAPFEVWLERVDLGNMSAFVPGQTSVAGLANGYVRLTGPLDAPVVDGRVSIDEGAVQDVRFRRLSAAIRSSGTRYAFEARMLQNETAWLAAEGSIPRGGSPDAQDRQINVQLRSSPVAIGFIGALTDAVKDVEGTLQADVRVSGTLDDPQFDGTIQIAGGAFSVPVLGTRFTGLDTSLRFQPEAVVVTDFRLVDENGQHLRVGGRLPYREGQLGSVAVAITSDDFEFVDNPVVDIHVSSDLRLTGTLTQPRIEGRVDITEGRVRVDRLMGQGDALYATQAATFANETPERVETTDDESAGLLEALPVALNVAVQFPALVLTGRDIRGPSGVPIGLGDIDITLSGDLQLAKAVDEALRLTGDLATVRGTYDFQGRRFEIVRDGYIRFPGLTTINPLLELEATRTISSVVAHVAIGGTLERPQLTLTSEPPLDPADVLSLIVFNQPASQLGAGEQVALGERAATLAAGFLTSQLASSLGNALTLDILDIKAAENVQGFTPEVTVGQQIGERLFVRLRQQLGAAAASQLILEYQLLDWLRLQSAVSDRQAQSRSLFGRSERTGLDWVVLFSY